MISRLFRSACLAGMLIMTPPVFAHEPLAAKVVSGVLPPSARAAAAVVDSFHAALRRGDTRSALALLVDDVIILEAGGVERSKSEYASHHLQADAEFSQAVPTVVTRRTGHSAGSMAWIATEGRTTGTLDGKPIDRITAETMLLQRVAGKWRIAHIHWSSAAAKLAKPDE